MPNLSLRHNGNMNITSAGFTSANTLDVRYQPNTTGAITGWTHNQSDPLVCGETYTILLYPQFSGTVLTENFTVSGYDVAGIQRSDTSVLRQGYNKDLRDYLWDVKEPTGRRMQINSSSVTESYLEVNATVIGYNSNYQTSLRLYWNNSDGISSTANVFFDVELPPLPPISSLSIVVPMEITDYGQASAVYTPSSSTVNLVYSISGQSNKATIDPVTGEITVLKDGTITVCVEDTISGLMDCTDVDVSITKIYAENITLDYSCVVVDSAMPYIYVYPANATVDLVYSAQKYPQNEPNDVASIDPDTGEVTVLRDGMAIFSVWDNISTKNSGVLVTCRKSVPTPETATTIGGIAITTDRIVDSGFVSVNYAPSNADVDLRFSNNTAPLGSTIDETTGELTVARTGIAQITVYDAISHNYDCHTLTLIDSEHPYDTGMTITNIELIVDPEIVEYGIATANYSPDIAYTELSFSSSDESLATIDSGGNITVLDNGLVTFCVEDAISGLRDCKQVMVRRAVYIDSIDIVVDDIVYVMGVASAEYTPTGGTVNLVYSSSDPDIAYIDPNTGEITVYESGYVTFCVRDTYTNMSDCKTVEVRDLSGMFYITYNVTSTTNPTKVIQWAYDAEYMGQFFNGIYYNGRRCDVSELRNFVFDETGEQTIYYDVKTTTLTFDNMNFVSPSIARWWGSDIPIIRSGLDERWEILPTNPPKGFFENSPIQEVIGGSNIKAITCYAFTNTNISTVYFPKLITVDDTTFSYCSNIKRITFPETLRTLHNNVFEYSSNLRYVTFEGTTPPSISNKTFNYVNLSAIIVPCEAKNAYIQALPTAALDRLVVCPDDMITAITLSLPSTIVDYATASTTYSPANNAVRLTYSSSDETVVYVNNSGVVTAFSNGSATITVKDELTSLEDSVTVNCNSTNEKRLVVGYNVTSTTQPTQISTTTYLSSFFSSAKLEDGTNVPLGNTGFTFSETGIQKIYYMVSETTIVHPPFNISNVVSVSLPNNIEVFNWSELSGASISEIYSYAFTPPYTDSYLFAGWSHTNGVLYYPSGANYSRWLNDLEGRGWTGSPTL